MLKPEGVFAEIGEYRKINMPDNLEILDPPESFQDGTMARDVLAVAHRVNPDDPDNPEILEVACVESVLGHLSEEGQLENHKSSVVVVCGYIMGRNVSLQMTQPEAEDAAIKCQDAKSKAAEHIYGLLKAGL